MSLLSYVSKPFAKWIVKRQQEKFKDPVRLQKKILKRLISKAQYTMIGEVSNFKYIKSYDDFRELVNIRPYENMRYYMNLIKQGELNVLWPDKPLGFVETSGTTEGNKYIPITKQSIMQHITTARNALLYYIHETGRTDFMAKKMLFLAGSPEIIPYGPYPSARLSGVVQYYTPRYMDSKQLPYYQTNIIKNWEEKLDEIVKITLKKKVSLVAGIPPWVQMYFDKIIQKTGKTIGDVFPNFSLLVHGGVRFDPYRNKLSDSIGRPVNTLETYPASEGFIAFQHSQQSDSMLLQLDSNLFFEFIPIREAHKSRPTRLFIGEVEIGAEYALVLSNNAGLWAYPLGDTIRFTSLNPPQIIVTGRTKQFISAFGEHLNIESIEIAMQRTLATYSNVRITEYTVAPMVSQEMGQDSYHEWLIEFSQKPEDMTAFAMELNQHLCQLNSYYNYLITGHILQPLQITLIRTGGFADYMGEVGKIGGQNKVVRVANNRIVANQLMPYRLTNSDQDIRS